MQSMLSPDFATNSISMSGLSGTIDKEIGTYPVGTRVEMTMTGEYTYSDHIGTTQQGVCFRTFEVYVRNQSGELNRLYLDCNVGEHTTSRTDTLVVQGTVILRQLGYDQIIVDGDWSLSIKSSLTLKRISGTTGAIGFYRPQFSYPIAADSVTAKDLPWSVEFHLVAVPSQSAGVYADKSTWRFVPDDGSPEQPACEYADGIDRCWRSKFFDRSGMLHVSGIVNGEYVDATPIHVVVPGTALPTISVNCAPRNPGLTSPIRGAVETCTATVTPRQPFVLTKWKAEGSGYLYSSPQRTSSGGTPVEWEGTVAIDTRVSAEASVLVNGVEKALPAASTTFVVTARAGPEWTGLRVQEEVPAPEWVSGSPLKEDPWTTTSQGTMNSPDGALGKYETVTNVKFAIISGGPNTNILYTKYPATRDPSRLFVHSDLLPQSAFYRKQNGNQNQVYGINYCTRSDIDRVREQVLAHEMLHYSEDKRYFVENDVQARLERAHGLWDVSTLGAEGSMAARLAAEQALLDASYQQEWRAIHETAVDENHKVQLPACKVRR